MSMKKSIKVIAKCALAVIGMLSFFVLVGEPTAEFGDFARDTVGVSEPVAIMAVKAMCIGLIAACCKVYERMEPGVFDE